MSLNKERLLPLTVPELIEFLDKNYPATLPKLDDPDRLIWKKIGQRELVEKLKAQLSADNLKESKLYVS